MTTYKDSGVDIEAGDNASAIAYSYAKKTFAARSGMIGAPLIMDGGFAGVIDMGEYYLVTNCDGVGTKISIAQEVQEFCGLGYDLLAMTADDAICTGAEVISITNTIDTNTVNSKEIEEMMKSLSLACNEQKVVIPGGEIGELGHLVQGTIWNSSAVGIVEKEKFISGDTIADGDAIIALKENGFRSNGFSLIRHILKQNNIVYTDEYSTGISWGKAILEPSVIYSKAVLSVIGRFKEPQKLRAKGIVHVTGGGIAGNLQRILQKQSLGANFFNLFSPPPIMQALQKMGDVSTAEAQKTWNMGNGMLIICDASDADQWTEQMKKQGIEAQIAGTITSSGDITV